MTTRTLAVITAGLSEPSSTRLLADRLAEATTKALAALGEETLVEVIDLRPLAHPLADNLLTGFATGDLARAQETVEGADAVIAVSPVFSASYSGLFKTFVDTLDRDALTGKPVLLGATAGTGRHSLVLEHAMRPLFSYLRALTVPTAVFAATGDFGDVRGGALSERIQRAAGELAQIMVGRRGERPVTAPAEGSFADETFGEVPDFETLLRQN